ncbi:MAG: hypothetical protein V1773_18375 [bacterium]
MRYREQGNYINVLKRYEKQMPFEEMKDFRMLKKRHTDDEDLDSISLARLKGYYEKYHTNRDKKNYDEYFRKNENYEFNEENNEQEQKE